MAVEIEAARRRFKHGDVLLEDPGEILSPEEVMEFFSAQYPELTNASIGTPEVADDETVIYPFITLIGTKG
jgi:PRTRC genetic system protein C